MSSRRGDRTRLLTTPQPIPVISSGHPPPEVRFRSFRIASADEIGRTCAESEIWGQFSRSDAPSQVIEIIPFAITLPSMPLGDREIDKFTKDVIAAIKECSSVRELHRLRQFCTACNFGLEENHSMFLLLQRGLDFQSSEFFIGVSTDLGDRGKQICQNAWDDLLAQCVKNRMPLAACACLCHFSRLPNQHEILYALNFLDHSSPFDTFASQVIQQFLLRFSDEVVRWPTEKLVPIILSLSPQVFTEDLWHVIDQIFTMNPPCIFFAQLLSKALRNGHFSYDWRVAKSLNLIAKLDSIAHVPREYLDELLTAASECSTPMYSLLCSSLFFDSALLSRVQLVHYLESISTCSDALVVFLEDRVAPEPLVATKSGASSEMGPSAVRCMAFHQVLECFIKFGENVSCPPCIRRAIEISHGSLAKLVSRTTDSPLSIAVFPLISMCRAFASLDWPLNDESLVDMLVNIVQGITNRLDSVGNSNMNSVWMDRAMSINPESIDETREAIDSVITSFLACATSTEPRKATEFFREQNTQDMRNSTLLVLDLSALQSLSDPEMADKFVGFMCANSKAQNMHAVIPFPVVIELLSLGQANNGNSASLSAMRNFISTCSTQYDWLRISSSSEILGTILEPANGSCASLDGKGACAMDITSILVARFQTQLQLRCRRVITVVHSVWNEFVFLSFGVRPIVQLPALLERGKPSPERKL